MVTWPLRATRPGRGAVRVALLLGLTSALVVGLTLVARGPLDVLSAADLDRMEDAVEQGCDGVGVPLAEGTAFALDGTVVDVVAPPDRSPVRVTLRVREWFLGPPVETVDVRVDPTTARHLAADGSGLAVGRRLLVSGRSWQGQDDGLLATGCGRTRGYDAATAEDWQRSLGVPGPARPAGPAATYPRVDYVRTATEPDLRGVAVLDSGCLYVQDGLTRWVPVLPSGTAAWQDQPPALTLGGVTTDVGHMVRLAGVPADGLGARGAGRTGPSDVAAGLVDPAGVPDACDPTAPRFVVAERVGPGRPHVEAAQDRSAPVWVALEAARRAGLDPTVVDGGLVTDAFGATSSRVALRTPAGADVLVHVESVAVLAWPHAYAPRDADWAWSSDPRHAGGLPPVPAGWQLAVVTRDDGVTQVLLRTPGRVVVSVSAELPLLSRSDVGRDGTAGVRTLTDVALDVAALSPYAAGS